MLILLMGHAVPAAAGEGLPGTWLLRTDHIDPYIDAGLLLPRYPVLHFGDDGRFALFFVSAYCFAPLGAGSELTQSEIEAWTACERMRQFPYAPAPRHLFARPAASGRWSADAQALELHVERVSEPPEVFALNQNNQLDAPRDFAALAERLNAARQAGPAFSAASAKRFYGDFFILGGGALALTQDADQLTLSRPAEAGSVVFERVAPEAIDQTMAILRALEVSAGLYFRCVLADTREPGRSGIPSAEWTTLVQLAQQISTDKAKARHAHALAADGQQDEAMRVWPQDARDRAAARIEQQMMSQPVITAARAGRLGAYLGCPEVDGAGR